MSSPKTVNIRRRVEALEDQLGPRLQEKGRQARLKATRRLTVNERRWLIDLMKAHGTENLIRLQTTLLSEKEQTELQRLITIMNDATAPPGRLRDERLGLGAWLENFEKDVVKEEHVQYLRMIRLRADEFIQNYGGSGWREDKALAERCRAFLRKHGDGEA